MSSMDSLLCNEDWLMSPDVALNNNNIQEDDAKGHVDNFLFSTKEDRDESLRIFLRKEYTSERGYSKFLKTNDVINNARFIAVYWLIYKSQRRMNFSTGTIFLAVNYLDRFISVTKCQGWKYWMFELLSVACLSIASKFNETITPPLHEFQVEGVDNCFAPSLIQRMELTVLKALSWRMDATTPFSYVHFLIQSIDDLNKTVVEDFTRRVTELLLNSLLENAFLYYGSDPEIVEFNQCVTAMSAVKCVFEDLIIPSTNNTSLAHLETVIPNDQNDDLIKCQMIMAKLSAQDHNMLLTCRNCWHGPSSPVTVLKMECFKVYKGPFDLSFLKTPSINVDLGSGRKRKREELECGQAVN